MHFVPRLSIYLSDELVARAKEFDREANMSQLVQTALRRLFGDKPGPDYARPPSDAEGLLRAAQGPLLAAARGEYEAGYRNALHRLPDIPWVVLDAFAGVQFDLDRWLNPWGTGPAEALQHLPGWFHKVAEDVGSKANPCGYDEFSSTKTRAFYRGYADGLRDAYIAVEHGMPAGSVEEDSLPERPSPDGGPEPRAPVTEAGQTFSSSS